MTNFSHVWPTLTFADAPAMTAWLTAIGFTEHASYRQDDDDSVVSHAEFSWPGGGGIMFGSQRPDALLDNVGTSALYLVCEDPDAVFTRAVEAGAQVVQKMREESYGGRGGSVRDLEGNSWSFGNFQP